MPINIERFGEDIEYIPKFDVGQLAERIKAILEDPKNYKGNIKKAKEFVDTHRAFSKTCSQFLDVLKEAIRKV